ncbi:hypothetical protein EIN_162110 [Entamoeba invadens IP1]|uniref:Sas10 C-terminal domain-containing protein n=1 Tax=Entamoeba invadens IP1 TaxID=370355 RepID=A0A0A1U1T5_ENTIV|nr:hypothetical protein EIN_162110 [Entamoeba invadens IP1]ELP86577.1 hypothetical protein EIN_162110 [Entamoeba invadens IP1]|eukprot:XP_004185923.1 hypothetical protein EIN_162110 [Entamoeba invadens IP1]
MSEDNTENTTNNTKWGIRNVDLYQKKQYNAEKHDAEENAEEAMNIQKEQLKNLQAADFSGFGDFDEILKTVKEAPIEKTEEYKLKKFNEMINKKNLELDGNEDENIQAIRAVYPDFMKRLEAAQTVTFMKRAGSGIMKKLTAIREDAEKCFLLNVLSEVLCKGNSTDVHPSSEDAQKFLECLQTSQSYIKTIGNKTIEAVYNGTYKDLIQQEEENGTPMELENPKLSEMDIENEDNENSDSLAEKAWKNKAMKWKKKRQIGSTVMTLILLKERANEVQRRKILTGEEDANTEKAVKIGRDVKSAKELREDSKAIKKPQEEENEEESEESEEEEVFSENEENKEADRMLTKLREKRKRIEDSRKERLEKQREIEENEDNERRPVGKVIQHGRGFTKQRKPQHARLRIRKLYDRKTRHDNKVSKKLARPVGAKYSGERKIDDMAIHSVKLSRD